LPAAALLHRSILQRWRPHFYTKDEELGQVMQEIQSIARTLQPA
jgi:hypothetical protein